MNLFTIVWDGLRRRKIRTTLSIVGIAIASTALFSLVSLKQGYESGMRAELDHMGAQAVAVAKGCPYEAIAVIMIGGQVPATLPEDVVGKIKAIPNIAGASPNAYGAYKYLNLSHPLIGITPEELKLKSWWKIKGRFPQKFGEVVLGGVEANVFAQKSGEYQQLGDALTVTAGGKQVPLKVVGVLENTGSKDDYSTYTTLETAQKLQGVIALFREINQAGKTIIVVTHNTELAASLPRAITLRDGRMVSDVRREPIVA